MNMILQFLDFLWASFLLLAPMLMIGLFLAGLIHVFISRQAILRWFHHDSLKSVTLSSAIGVPMPLCSCSVVPVVAEMRRKGASRSAAMSFLITAPETGADSILVTNAFFGPIVAIVRPIISFMTAVVCGIFCIGMIRDKDSDPQRAAGEDEVLDARAGHETHDHHDHSHGHGHGHDHDHDHSHKQLFVDRDDCYVSWAQMKLLIKQSLSGLGSTFRQIQYTSWLKPEFYQPDRKMLSEESAEPSRKGDEADEPVEQPDLKAVIKHIFRYGFVEVADDILFALLVGIALGGVLFLVIPSDLMASEYARWLAYPVMVLIGVPLYICASASTPIAAALVLKGVSPGAALVFLMTGPATNTGTIAIIVSQFGVRFASIYVGGVIAVTVVLGIIVDLIMFGLGWNVAVNLGASESPTILALQWAGAISLAALIVWRFKAGALKSGWDDLLFNVQPLAKRLRSTWTKFSRKRGFRALLIPWNPAGFCVWIIAGILFIGSGFTTVPPGNVGYGLLFGQVYWRDLEPGLHYLAPFPFARVDRWPIHEVKSVDSDVDHEYVAGDLNLVLSTVNVQYRVKDPYTYHYRMSDPATVIRMYLQSQVREFISSRRLDPLLNEYRDHLESFVFTMLSEPVEQKEVLDTIEVIKVSLTGIDPAVEASNAFREVSSAQEDRERIIVNAQRFLISLTPQAHGNAFYEVQQADGQATRRTASAKAEASAISKIATATQSAPDVLQYMLWREKLETALSGNTKIIVPNHESLEKVALWKQRAPTQSELSSKEN